MTLCLSSHPASIVGSVSKSARDSCDWKATVQAFTLSLLSLYAFAVIDHFPCQRENRRAMLGVFLSVLWWLTASKGTCVQNTVNQSIVSQ